MAKKAATKAPEEEMVHQEQKKHVRCRCADASGRATKHAIGATTVTFPTDVVPSVQGHFRRLLHAPAGLRAAAEARRATRTRPGLPFPQVLVTQTLPLAVHRRRPVPRILDENAVSSRGYGPGLRQIARRP